MDKPEPRGVPTAKDRLVEAIMSLVTLLFLAVLTLGATSVLQVGLIGWFAIPAVIGFTVITINIAVSFYNPH